jgi:hypothetical protein
VPCPPNSLADTGFPLSLKAMMRSDTALFSRWPVTLLSKERNTNRCLSGEKCVNQLLIESVTVLQTLLSALRTRTVVWVPSKAGTPPQPLLKATSHQLRAAFFLVACHVIQSSYVPDAVRPPGALVTCHLRHMIGDQYPAKVDVH